MAGIPTRYCDLVMKGGITSGIVYPNAVIALSKDFRFKNIGGTSAGAIAAAATAAAAIGDRKKANARKGARANEKQGFEGLNGVAANLAREGFIYSLFQPASGARSAYRMIVTLAGNAGLPRKAAAAFGGIFAIAPLEIVAIAAALLGYGFLVAGAHGVLAALLPAVVCAYLGGAVCALLRVARVARRNLLGLCSGLRVKRGTNPALTEWLHDVLQSLSGKRVNDPLVFNDLWTAPRYEGEPEAEKAISLQMITTGVSHHEPRTLPFTDAVFWFLREEFDMLFPKPVVDWMVRKAGVPVILDGKTYYKLPTRGDMPVLVAMRMSLSFPLLISAVPLHEAATHERTSSPDGVSEIRASNEKTAKNKSLTQATESLTTGGDSLPSNITEFRRCWFSDGGISSNFPIHLFDAALPLWPTFAINLVYPNTDDSDAPAAVPNGASERDKAEAAVYLPTSNNVGWQRTYEQIEHKLALREIGGFLFAIIATMQNWRDLLQARSPGQRDRIVRVSLDAAEGGMNLNMPQPVLDIIALKGTVAGERLYQFSFDNHYWIRWRNLASAVQRYTVAIAANDRCQPKIPAYVAAFSTAKSGTPPPVSYKFKSKKAKDAAEELLDHLVRKGEEWNKKGPDLSVNAPRPLPELQITPTY